ncbi:MAG: hypothetical protein GX234_06885 [Clostridiales bacterium]|nr:hypothetical protein [Clostridiales bacterium]
MKKIDVLGITLKNYSKKEALKETDRYMKGGAMHTVIYVSAKQLIRASENSRWKEWMERADLTLYADPDILKADDSLSGNRLREIEEHQYLHEFLKKAAKNRYKIFLLSDSAEHVESLRENLLSVQGELILSGEGILPENEGTDEDSTLVNEMNDVAPGVIVSRLPFDRFCSFVERNRRYVNADMILNLPEEDVEAKTSSSLLKLAGYAYRGLFRHKVKKYKNQEKVE